MNRVAIVTGGGTGIGRATAIALSKSGFDVAIAGRREAPLLEVAGEIERTGHIALAIPADLTGPVAVSALFNAVRERFGRLDLLFNNAGASAPAVPLEDLDIGTWRKVVDINLTGAFLCTQEAIRQFKSQIPRGGRIINNGSLSAHVPRVNSAAYTASKHAIWGLTKSTALEGRPFDIACGQIDVGNAATSMSAPPPEGLPQADGSRFVEPMIHPATVAEAVVYMAGLPLSANVLTMTVMATKMPYIGRG